MLWPETVPAKVMTAAPAVWKRMAFRCTVPSMGIVLGGLERVIVPDKSDPDWCQRRASLPWQVPRYTPHHCCASPAELAVGTDADGRTVGAADVVRSARPWRTAVLLGAVSSTTASAETGIMTAAAAASHRLGGKRKFHVGPWLISSNSHTYSAIVSARTIMGL
jgi:hypothetical protein